MSSKKGTELAVAEQLTIEINVEGFPAAQFMCGQTSLDIVDPHLPIEVWIEGIKKLGWLDRTTRWWIGDGLNAGEALYGEDAAQAVDDLATRYDMVNRVTGLDPGTVQNIRSVCAKVPRANRRPELGFWIHAEVASLEPDEQVEWLQRCIDENWNRAELRTALRADKKPPQEPLPDPDGGGEGGDGKTAGERLEQAARLCYRTGRIADGEAHVPIEGWRQLAAALGEEQ